jgi:hypothetical protein
MNPYFLRALEEMGVREPTPAHNVPTPNLQPHPLGDWPKKPVGEPPH